LKLFKQRKFIDDKKLLHKAECVFHVEEYITDAYIDFCVVFKLSRPVILRSFKRHVAVYIKMQQQTCATNSEYY
jgi:hypothetical protein